MPAPARIPDDVALPELPLGAEAAHPLPVQEGSLLRQRPHHAVAGSDLGQRERTVDLHGSGAGTIHAETCRGPQGSADYKQLLSTLPFLVVTAS